MLGQGRVACAAVVAMLFLGAGSTGPAAAQVGPTVEAKASPVVAGRDVVVVGRSHPDSCATRDLTVVALELDGDQVALVETLDGGSFQVTVAVPDHLVGQVELATSCKALTRDPAMPGVPLASSTVTVRRLGDGGGPSTDEPSTPVEGGGHVEDDAAASEEGVMPATEDEAIDGETAVRDEADARPSPPTATAVRFTGSAAPATTDVAEPITSSAPDSASLEQTAPADIDAGRGGSPLPESDDREDAGDVAAPAVSQWMNRDLDVSAMPSRVLSTAALAALFAVLIGFPAALFDTTVRRNYDQIFRGRWVRRSVTDAVRSRLQALPDGSALIFVALVAGAVSVLVDPGAGFDVATAQLALGVAAAIGTVCFIGWRPIKRAGDVRGYPGRWRAYPSALLIVFGCVCLTRGLGIVPGYLYGLIVSYDFVGSVDEHEEVRTYIWAFVSILAAACLSWAAWMVLGPIGDGGVGRVADIALTTVVVAGIEGSLFGLVPWKNTPAGEMRAVFPRSWLALLSAAIVLFAVLLVEPGGDIFDLPTTVTLVTAAGGFLFFAVVSLGTWWRFGLRPTSPDAAEPDGAEASVLVPT